MEEPIFDNQQGDGALSRPKLSHLLFGLPLVFMLSAGCSGAPASPTVTSTPMPPTAIPALEEPGWALISLNGNSLIEGTRITLSFDNGFVSGFAGCNSYRSHIVGTDARRFMYRATDDGSLTIPGFVITEKDCPAPEGVMQQEMNYAEALRNAASYRLAEDRLEIANAAGETILVFASYHHTGG